MDYKNLQNKLFYGLLIIAVIYALFCITDSDDPREKHNKAFAHELAVKLETIKDLDSDEKRQIYEQMSKIMNKKSKRVSDLAKKSLTSALRGGLAGGLMGGMEGALSGGVVFGVITPVIILVESMM